MAKEYRKKLSNLDPSGYMLKRRDNHLCLLTGQSSFKTSRLDKEKLDFLNHISDQDLTTVTIGFPWHNEFDILAGKPALIAATIRNIRQYLWLNLDKEYKKSVSNIIRKIVEMTDKKLVIITGSCGIGYLSCALENIKVTNELWVLALGPVGSKNINSKNISRFHVIQGHNDIWSKLLWLGNVDEYTNCGHMEYYKCPQTLRATRSFIKG